MNSRYKHSVQSRSYCVHYGPSGNARNVNTDASANEKEAYAFAGDTTKQLITLSSAIIAVTVTFAKDIFAIAPGSSKVALVVAWLSYIVSLVFGVLTMMALTAEIGSPSPAKPMVFSGDEPKEGAGERGIWGSSVTGLATIQILVFLVATAAVVICGFGFAYGEYAKHLDRDRVKNLRPTIVSALRLPDVNKLNELFAADCRFRQANGEILNKTQLIADLSTRRLSIDDIQTEPFKMEFLEETATETGLLRAVGSHDGKSFAETYRYTIVYSKRSDKWKAVLVQMSDFQ